MQIKTIWKPLDYIGMFDNTVNDALEDGWRLTKREILPQNLLYAELVKLDQPPEQPPMDPMQAVQILADTCKNADECSRAGCPLHEWCDRWLPDAPAPSRWLESEEART